MEKDFKVYLSVLSALKLIFPFQGISSRKALIIRILSKQSLFLFSALGQTVLWILSTNSLFLEVQPRLRLAVNMEFKKLDSHIWEISTESLRRILLIDQSFWETNKIAKYTCFIAAFVGTFFRRSEDTKYIDRLRKVFECRAHVYFFLLFAGCPSCAALYIRTIVYFRFDQFLGDPVAFCMRRFLASFSCRGPQAAHYSLFRRSGKQRIFAQIPRNIYISRKYIIIKFALAVKIHS